MQLTPARGVFGDEPVWFHEPARWRRSGPDLTLTTDHGTDFWRHTRYGHVHDNGHFLGVRMLGDFQASVDVEATFTGVGDHAGLMVRMDAERWITGGVELGESGHSVTAVVTHGVSDRSVTALGEYEGRFGVRMVRSDDSLTVEVSRNGGAVWVPHRLCYLPPGLPAFVGPTAASPTGDGFDVVFKNVTLSAS